MQGREINVPNVQTRQANAADGQVQQPEIHKNTTEAPKTLWEQGRLAATLALVSGFADAYATLNYKIFVSFMSGNTTQTGAKLGEWNLAESWHALLPILAFVVGAFTGTMLLHSGIKQARRPLFVLVAVLLAASVIASAYFAMSPDWLHIVLLAVAMGAVNISVGHIGAQSVGLGYVSGTLSTFSQNVALAFKGLPVPGSKGAWDTHGRRMAALASVWFAFLIGAVLGGALTTRFAVWALLLPILILAALAAFDRTTDDID